jgi:hypothetical protein
VILHLLIIGINLNVTPRLENAFRNFATLTQGDIIQITYNSKIYEIKVLEIRPNYDDHGGISIMETDLEVNEIMFVTMLMSFQANTLYYL